MAHIKQVIKNYENISRTNPLLPVKLLWDVMTKAISRSSSVPSYRHGYASKTYFDLWIEDEFEKILNEQIEEYENNQPEHFKFTPSYSGGKIRSATKRNKIKKNKTYKKHQKRRC